jgi:YidC/Oxa1 family membrane protein insertase
MDRKTIIGLVMALALFGTFMVIMNWNKDKTPPATPAKTDTAATQAANSPKAETPAAPLLELPKDSVLRTLVDSTGKPVSDSAAKVLQLAKDKESYGEFAPVMSGTADTIHVITDLLDVKIPTKGASIYSLQLQKYYEYDSVGKQPIVKPDGYNAFDFAFGYSASKQGFIHSQDIYFKPDAASREVKVTGGDSAKINFVADLGKGRTITIAYVFKGNAYDFGFDVTLNNMQEVIKGGGYDLTWKSIIPKTEKAMKLMRDKTTIEYRNFGEHENIKAGRNERQEEFLQGAQVDWVAFKSQFFTQTLIVADQGYWQTPKLIQDNPLPPVLDDPLSGNVVKLMEAQLPISYQGNATETRKFRMYTGPLEYNTLNSYDLDLERQIGMGWGPLRFINRWMILPLFQWLGSFIGSYGIIILLLALFIKLITYPFTYRTFMSSAKMRVINQTDKMKALDVKYKDDPTKLQTEKMSVYRSMGVNPLGGCVPMLLSYPFLMALFFFFPNLIELRQESLFWAEDLSTYDSIYDLGFNIPFYGDHISLWTILMTASIFAFTLVNQKNQPAMANNPAMKYLPYIMPIIFLGVLNNYSAGLSYYYFLSQILSIAQTQLTKLFVDDKKVLAQLEEVQKKKSSKPGGGKGWLERRMEAAQKQQREMQKAKNDGKKR